MKEVIQITGTGSVGATADALLEDLLAICVGRICFLAAVWLLFSSVCQQSSLLPPPLYSLNPLCFHRASRYSRVSIATLADMQQVSVSSGTGFSALPLAAQWAPGGSDWLAGPSWLMVFTEMGRRADWLQTQKEKKPRRKKKRRLQDWFHKGIKRVKMEEAS